MKKIISTLILLSPLVVFAQQGPTFSSILFSIGQIARALVPLFAGAAFLLFLWGIAKFIYAAGKGDETGVREGKKVLLWGVIALFILTAFLVIAAFLRNEFGFDETQPPDSLGGVLPLLPESSE